METSDRNGQFATTHWSVVLSAAQSRPGVTDAWEELCRGYWQPLYAYVRRTGVGPADAEDLTQDFLADLLRRESLRTVDPEKGRFRSFLLVALKRFLLNAKARSQAAKRGGARVHVPLDTELAESRYLAAPESGSAPDLAFERRWALDLLERVLGRLRVEAIHRGKSSEYDILKSFLTVESSSTEYAETAARLGTSSAAARVAVHRLRRRFRELLRDEVAHTVSRPEDIDDEIRFLLASLGR